MIKIIGCLRRKPGVSEEEFHHHWKDVHGPLVMSVLPFARHVRKYIQNHKISGVLPTSDRYQGLAMDFDGVVEMYFDSYEEVQAAMEALADPEVAKPIRQDEETFIDLKSIVTLMVCDEVTIAG
jgi:uncharacterized protein (TIGR02118 family)